jgi:hypothetical protein
MDGGMLEEAVGARLICNLVLQRFWKGRVLNYQYPCDKINPNRTGVLDLVETLLL